MKLDGSLFECGGDAIPVLLMARELGGRGGIERDVSKFARYLPKYGIAPHVACFNPGGARWCEIEQAGIPVVAIPFKSLKSPSVVAGFCELRRYIAKHRIQVLHAFDFSSDVFGVPAARMLRIPVTISSHLWQREHLPRHMRMLLPIVDRLATGLFTNSEAVARELACRSDVARERIYVCHNGFEAQEFNPLGRKRPSSLADASVVIGTVAVLREEKNLKLLLQAFARGVWPSNKQARLLIVGDGPMKLDLLALSAKLGIGSACVFEPATPNAAQWMRAIDVFVVPSDSESFSNALLEAMACGCCPVGSWVGGTPELLSHGDCGFLFKPGNVIQLATLLGELVRDAHLQQAVAQRACRFVFERFTIDIAAARLSQIYRCLLARQGLLLRNEYESSGDMAGFSNQVESKTNRAQGASLR